MCSYHWLAKLTVKALYEKILKHFMKNQQKKKIYQEFVIGRLGGSDG